MLTRETYHKFLRGICAIKKPSDHSHVKGREYLRLAAHHIGTFLYVAESVSDHSPLVHDDRQVTETILTNGFLDLLVRLYHTANVNEPFFVTHHVETHAVLVLGYKVQLEVVCFYVFKKAAKKFLDPTHAAKSRAANENILRRATDTSLKIFVQLAIFLQARLVIMRIKLGKPEGFYIGLVEALTFPL